MAACADVPGASSDDLAADPFADVGTLEQGATLSCADLALCHGGETYTSYYRIGATSTSRGELLQAFTTAPGTPARLRVPLRRLRAYAGAAKVHAQILALDGGLPAVLDDVAIDAASVKAHATLPVASLADDSEFDFAAGGGSASALGAGTYVLYLWTDDTADAPLLLGVGSLSDAGDAFEGDTLRRAKRAVGGSFADARFRPAGGTDVAFGLDLSGTPAHCNALKAAGAATGFHTIDPDGAGPVSPFQTYCDMEAASGGWTLVELRSQTTPATLVASITSLAQSAVAVNDAAWNALKAQSTQVLLEASTGEVAAILNIARMTTANCTPLASSLAADFLAHQENSGCDANNIDYCLWGYGPTRRNAVYNLCAQSFFDAYPAATEFPFRWEPDAMRVFVR